MILAPKWIVFQLNEICNLRCFMCYQWGDKGIYLEKKPSSLSYLPEDLIVKVIDECLAFEPYIGLFGGEPLLYKNIWRIIKKVKDHKGEIYIDTNGTTLSRNALNLVESRTDRIWVSLDGPQILNDKQRGNGVFQKVILGIDKLYDLRSKNGSTKPEIGITFIVTPVNFEGIEQLFCHDLDLTKIDNISIEFQNFLLFQEWRDYDELLIEHFDKHEGATHARGLIKEIEEFSKIDHQLVNKQILAVKSKCNAFGVNLLTAPRDYSSANIKNYFKGDWDKISNRKTSCSLPWKYAEISAKGDVTLCHTFYDNSIGNIKERSFMEIWNGDSATRVRSYLKKQLYSICTGCSRYHTSQSLRK